MKLHIGDQVQVKSGKDKGKKGKVERVLPKLNKVVVAGINMSKRNVKPQSTTKQGGIIDIVKPISVGNISFVCPKCNLPSRIGFVVKNNEKNRFCKKCNQIVD
jgi:large subunit ribosomal protein L24